MLISLVLPVYNVEEYLPQCLDSIINQTYTDLQIIMIDDGSKDDSWCIMQDYAEKDNRIEIYHQDNKGVASTRNELLNHIKGEYFLFVDADDWIEPDMVETMVRVAKKTNADITVCDRVINDEPVNHSCNIIYSLNRTQTVEKFLLHKDLNGSLCNKLIKTNLLKKYYETNNEALRFEKDIWYGEDALFCWHLIQHLDKMIIIDSQFYHYRMNDASISHQAFGMKKITGHDTWHIINETTALWWPEYINIAQARWGMEDMFLLRQAGLSKYKKDENIKKLQNTVKCYLPQMKAVGLLRGKEILNAAIICRWYGYNYLYGILNRLKRKFK